MAPVQPSLTPTFFVVGFFHLLIGGVVLWSATIPGCQTQALAETEPLWQELQLKEVAARPLNDANQAKVAQLLEDSRRNTLKQNRVTKGNPEDPASRISFFPKTDPLASTKREVPVRQPKPPASKTKPTTTVPKPEKETSEPEPAPVAESKPRPVSKEVPAPAPKVEKPKPQPKPKPKPKPEPEPEQKQEPKPKPVPKSPPSF
ncbi:MAG: hypothetical protein AAF514_00650 [Verrucomicrobiota bacterium]